MIIDTTAKESQPTPLLRGRKHALLTRQKQPLAATTGGGGHHLSFSLSPIEGEVQEIKIDHLAGGV